MTKAAASDFIDGMAMDLLKTIATKIIFGYTD